MIRKYGTINEEVNRIKSLFGESHLYGNLVEQDEQSDDVCEWFKPNQVEALDILKEVLILAKAKKISLIFEPEEQKKIGVLIEMLEVNIKTIEDINCEGGIVIVCSTENTTKIDGGIELLNSKLEDWPDGENKNAKTKLEKLVVILNEIKGRCADAVGNHNDDKPEGWYKKPIDSLRLYGVPEGVIDKMEGNSEEGEYNWKYEDSKLIISIRGLYGKPDWGDFYFIEEGKPGWGKYWVGKSITVFNIGKDNQNSYVMEGKLVGDYLFDGKYNNLYNADEYGVESETEGEIKNGYITIDGEITDPFKVDGGIVDNDGNAIYKKVQELRSEDGNGSEDGNPKNSDELIKIIMDPDSSDDDKKGAIDTLKSTFDIDLSNGKPLTIDSEEGVQFHEFNLEKPKEGSFGTYLANDGVLIYKKEDLLDDLDITTTDPNAAEKLSAEKLAAEDDKPKMKEGYSTEEDIIYISEKEGNREFKLGKMEYDKDKEVFKIISKYPFYSKKTDYLVKRTEESFWNTLSKWYTKELNSDNTTLDIKNGKKFKVIIK